MDLNHKNLIKVIKLKPSLKNTSSWFGVSEDTIERRVKEWEGITFKDFRDKYSYEIKETLVNKAFELAMDGNTTMLIFCLKNLCGWSNEGESKENTEHTTEFTLNYKIEQN